MKAITLFDGSPACLFNLEVVCREAYEEQFLSGEQAQPISILISIFECWPSLETPSEQTLIELARNSEALLQQAEKIVQRWGIRGVTLEIVCVVESDLTQALAERAAEWKASTLYLPGLPESCPATTSTKPKNSFFQRLFARRSTRPSVLAQTTVESNAPCLAAQIDPPKLLKKLGCQLVLTANGEIWLKMRQFQPTPNRAGPKTSPRANQEMVSVLEDKDKEWTDMVIPTRQPEPVFGRN